MSEDQCKNAEEIYRAPAVLYVIVRNDLQSLNAGKSEAHSGHAACAFMYEHVFKAIQPELNGIVSIYEHKAALIEWVNATEYGFGTQVNLDANIDQMYAIKAKADESGLPCNIITDPTYPFKVGIDKFTRSEQTALYIFGRSDDYLLKNIIGNYRLKP